MAAPTRLGEAHSGVHQMLTAMRDAFGATRG